MSAKLVRFIKEAWDVCWLDSGNDTDVKPFLERIPAGAKKVLEGHITSIARYGPKGQCRPITGKPGLFEIKERNDGNFYRIFCFYSKKDGVGQVYLLGNCYVKQSGKIPGDVLKRAVKVKRVAEKLDLPPEE